jgi:hypothetical protein
LHYDIKTDTRCYEPVTSPVRIGERKQMPTQTEARDEMLGALLTCIQEATGEARVKLFSAVKSFTSAQERKTSLSRFMSHLIAPAPAPAPAEAVGAETAAPETKPAAKAKATPAKARAKAKKKTG